MLMGQVERDAPKDLLVPREGRLIPISRPSAINAVGATPIQVRGGLPSPGTQTLISGSGHGIRVLSRSHTTDSEESLDFFGVAHKGSALKVSRGSNLSVSGANIHMRGCAPSGSGKAKPVAPIKRFTVLQDNTPAFHCGRLRNGGEHEHSSLMQSNTPYPDHPSRGTDGGIPRIALQCRTSVGDPNEAPCPNQVPVQPKRVSAEEQYNATNASPGFNGSPATPIINPGETAGLAPTTVQQDRIHLTSVHPMKSMMTQQHRGHHPFWLFLFPKHRMLPDWLR